MHLLGRIDKLRAHACRWAVLPLTSVPSAAVSDEQTSAWSDELYDRDLNTDPEAREEPPETVQPGWDAPTPATPPVITGMRPRVLRRRLGLAFLGAILAGCVLGTGIAKADPAVDSYTINSAPGICAALDKQPDVDNVVNILAAIYEDGFTSKQSGEIIARAVVGFCPDHMPQLDAFVAKYGKRVRA